MEQRKMKKQYSDEFKRDAVALLRSSNRPIKEVAGEIGVSDTTLGTWVVIRWFRLSGSPPFVVSFLSS